MITFRYIAQTGVSKEEILRRANEVRNEMNARFGDDAMSLQEAVDGAIDAAIEYNQG